MERPASLDRRRFLARAGLVGAALAAPGLASCQTEASKTRNAPPQSSNASVPKGLLDEAKEFEGTTVRTLSQRQYFDKANAAVDRTLPGLRQGHEDNLAKRLLQRRRRQLRRQTAGRGQSWQRRRHGVRGRRAVRLADAGARPHRGRHLSGRRTRATARSGRRDRRVRPEDRREVVGDSVLHLGNRLVRAQGLAGGEGDRLRRPQDLRGRPRRRTRDLRPRPEALRLGSHGKPRRRRERARRVDDQHLRRRGQR